MVHCQYVLTPSTEDLDLKLIYCGKESCTPDYTWVPTLPDRFLIHFIYSGKGTFRVNDKTYYLKSNQGFLICPNDIASYTSDSKDPWTYAWFEFNGRLATQYLKQIGLSKDNRIFLCKNENLIHNAFQGIFEACKLNRNNNLLTLSSLYYILAMIDETAYSKYPPETALKPKDSYVQQVLLYIDKFYSRDLCISEISDHLCLNRNYLTKIFKETMGVTPKAYLVNFRMQKAAALMHTSYLTISEIANMVGYSDPLLFSKMFKKVIGISPRDYRNRLL